MTSWLTILLFTWTVHPIHISVTEIEHDSDRKAVEISTRIFIDDLEAHIRDNLNEPYLDITNPDNGKSTDQLLKDYLSDRLSLEVNGKVVEYEYLGHEVEGIAMYVFIQVLKVKKLSTIKVRNTVLMDYYDDQTNIVHVRVNNEEKSLRLMLNEKQGELNF